jgi:hypothetical protein
MLEQLAISAPTPTMKGEALFKADDIQPLFVIENNPSFTIEVLKLFCCDILF